MNFTGQNTMENKERQEQQKEKREFLALAKDLWGEERIKAYALAGREDLASDYANELLRGVDRHYGRGPSAFYPYNPQNWEVLRQKQEFDRSRVKYSQEAVKDGLVSTRIEPYIDHPSADEINTIDDVLESNGANQDERKEFFTNLRERAKENRWSDEISTFIFRRKETAYSNLASHTDIQRSEVVSHYLEGLFQPKKLHGVIWDVDDWIKRLSKFVKRENADRGLIIKLAEKAIDGFRTYSFSSTYEHDGPSFAYSVLNGVSQLPNVKLPKELIVKTLSDYVRTGGELMEGYYERGVNPIYWEIKDDPEVKRLREQSLRHEIERGPACLVERVRYAVNELGLDHKSGWLKEALDNVTQRWANSSDEFEMSCAIGLGRNYGLLTPNQIQSLERKLKLIKKLKGDKE